MKRQISISIHDYNRIKLCDLYNSNTRVDGQAYDVVVTKEESGWKELSFSIPAVVMENGILVPNHRYESLRNEYLISVKEGYVIDWFIISEPNIAHRDSGVEVDVVCNHISSLLKTKNLYLELDDTNGIGTCSQIANTILQNTGWTLGECDIFYEKDGTTLKVRTLKSATKIGSYQMIINLCNLFNARPTFNGDNKTIDIRTYNPFNNPLDPSMPIVNDATKVFELNYGKALNGISRKLDTSSLITRLNVEGEYSDTGYIGIESVNDELGFLTDFSYFEALGIFTPTHQIALTNYLNNASAVKTLIKGVVTTINEKETEISTLWGSNYGIYDVVNVVNSKTISLSSIYETPSTPIFEAGDWVLLMNVDGTHIYSKIESGSINNLVLQDTVATSAHTKAVVFFTPSSGIIGGKESALFAAEALRQKQLERLDELDIAYSDMHVFALPYQPSSGVIAGDYWVDTNYINIPAPNPNDPIIFYVKQYIGGVWVQVDGRRSSYAEAVAKTIVQIDALLHGNAESDGLYTLAIQANSLARELPDLYATYNSYVNTLNEYENIFSTAMGDMLRDGYWNDSNYAAGQESDLLDDAKEIIKVMSQPIGTYLIDMVDLYESQDLISIPPTDSLVGGITTEFIDDDLYVTVPSDVPGISFPSQALASDGDLTVSKEGGAESTVFYLNNGYLFINSGGWLSETFVAPSWQDIDIDFCVHIVDPEINISSWGFVERIKKCYDRPWATEITVSTKASDVTGKSFIDVLASIAAIAEEVRSKSDVYDRSKIISSAREISASALQGIIDVNKTALLSSMSNWGTDNNGNIVFQSLDGRAAMMLTGMGFMIANEKDLDGNWIWRTFGTGDGFTADEINAGVLNAGIVQILGTDQFYWDADNIYIYDITEPLNQIRIGRYDGEHYGIGFTKDGGLTWQTAIGFDGAHLGEISYQDFEEIIGDTVSFTQMEYRISTSPTELLGGYTWSINAPAPSAGQYLWSRTKVIYTNETFEYVPNETGTNISGVLGIQGLPGANGSPGVDGIPGVDAKLITLNATSQVMKVAADGTTITPSTATITAFLQATAITAWTYSVNGGAFSSTAPNGVSRAGNTVVITGSTMTANTIAVKATDGTYADVITIAKVYDGEDAYTVLLSNENHTFVGLNGSSIVQDTTSYITVLKGVTAIAATVGTITGHPTGLSTSIGDNGTVSPYITFSTLSTMVSTNGTLLIPITADGHTFAKSFTYTLSMNNNTHFTSTPAGPYRTGDTWYQSTTGKIYICIIARVSGFSQSDWRLQSINAAFNGTTASMATATDMKIGDIWSVNGEVSPNEWKNGATYYYNGSAWVRTSTSFLRGAKIAYDAEAGTVDILAANTMNLSGGDLNISGTHDINMGAGNDLNMVGSNINVTGTGSVGIAAGANFNVRAGSGGTAMGISNNESNGYLMWAGHATPASAPFSVKMDGTITNIGNAWVQTMADNASNLAPLTMDVIFPSDITLVDKCLLSIKLNAFRAYSTGAASGGGQTSSSGGAQTSSDGGAQTSSTVASIEKTSYGGYGTTGESTGATALTANPACGLMSSTKNTGNATGNTADSGAMNVGTTVNGASGGMAATKNTGAATGSTGAPSANNTANATSTGTIAGNIGATGGATPATGGPSAKNTAGATSTGTIGGNIGSTGNSTPATGAPSTNSTSDAGSHTHTNTNHRHQETGTYTGYFQTAAQSAGSHSHTLYSHTHTVAEHSHSLNNHAHSLTMDSHSHGPGSHTHTVDDHTHSMNSHAHALTMAAHAHGPGTHTHSLNDHFHSITEHSHVGSGDHTHSQTLHSHGLNSHNHALTDHSHLGDGGTHSHGLAGHTHAVGSHTHKVTIDAHDHTIVAHNHTIVDHTHTVDNHTHNITYGIYEGTTPTSFELFVDGVSMGSYSGNQVNIDIAPNFTKTTGKITRNIFHTVAVKPNTLGRVSMHLYNKTTQISKVAGTL